MPQRFLIGGLLILVLIPTACDQASQSQTESTTASSNNANGDNPGSILRPLDTKELKIAQKIAELKSSLRAWLDSLINDDETPADDAVDIGGFIAFYKID